MPDPPVPAPLDKLGIIERTRRNPEAISKIGSTLGGDNQATNNGGNSSYRSRQTSQGKIDTESQNLAKRARNKRRSKQ